MIGVRPHPNVLVPSQAMLVISDLQDGFQPVIHEFDRIIERTTLVTRAAALLDIPILITEQYPQRLGTTVSQIRTALPAKVTAIGKTAFSACGAGAFVEQLARLPQRQVMLCGIETHICVSQTAHDLLARGYQVHVLADCVSSRTPANREIGLAKMHQSGALPGSSEMALFELLGDARHEQFKAISKMIK